MNYLVRRFSLMSLLLIFFLACKKSVQVDSPKTRPNSNTVFKSDATAAAVLTSIYGKMSEASNFAQGTVGVSILTGLAADELKSYPTSGESFQLFYKNAASISAANMWADLYQYIYIANAALEGLNRSENVKMSLKNQLIGEAKFVRAFCYFYLVNLWGDVPLITVTDYRQNAIAPREAKDHVIELILDDLKSAQNLLPDQYVTPLGAPTTERVRPNKAAATALLARVFLYTGDWVNAEIQASEVISNPKFSMGLLTNTFSKQSTEAIWQIAPVNPGYNTFDGNTFILTSAPNGSQPVSLRPEYLSVFEKGDQRRLQWIDSITVSSVNYYYPAKYKIKGGTSSTAVSEYLTMLRLAEQYLIRAEARVQQDKISEAAADLLVVRKRAGLEENDLTVNDKTSMLAAILHERQTEFFTEWGHRWLDLKRTGNLDAVMAIVCPLKGGTWDPNKALYPIPQKEIDLNPNMSQNHGY